MYLPPMRSLWHISYSLDYFLSLDTQSLTRVPTCHVSLRVTCPYVSRVLTLIIAMIAALLGSFGSSRDSTIHFVNLSTSDNPETPIAETASNLCIALEIMWKVTMKVRSEVIM